jgi:hypothetical protein
MRTQAKTGLALKLSRATSASPSHHEQEPHDVSQGTKNACRGQSRVSLLPTPAFPSPGVPGDTALAHGVLVVNICSLFSNQVVPDRGEHVTLSGVVGACEVFDKPCRIVPGITGP